MEQPKRRSPGRPRTSEQTESTRDLVLNKAIQLFLDRGYVVVSIDDIAKDCGVTKATVYYYFSSKTKLFTESMIQMMNRIHDHIQMILSGPGALKERLQNITKAHLKATFQMNLDAFMQGAKEALSEDQIKKMREAEERMYKGIEQAFQDAMEQNEIPKINSTFAAHSYLSLLEVGNYRDKDNRPIFPTVEETAEHIVQFFWTGLFSFHNGS